MKSNQSCCLGGLHFSPTLNQSVYKKLNPKIKKPIKNVKGTCSICGRIKSQIPTK